MKSFLLLNIRKLFNLSAVIADHDRAPYLAYGFLYQYGFFGHILFTPFFIYLGNPVALANNCICILLDYICIRLNTKSRYYLAIIIWVSEITVHAFTCTVIFGWEPGFYFYYLALTIAVLIGRWPALMKGMLTGFFFSVQGFLFFYCRKFSPFVVLDNADTGIIYFANIVANFLAVVFLAYFYLRVMIRVEQELKKRNNELERIQTIMQNDLRLAVQVQMSIFKRTVPQPDNYEISLYFKPMMSVSGDLYDFILKDGKLRGVALFDVSGHGVASALITMISKSVIDRHFEHGDKEDLSMILQDINDDLVREIGMTKNYLAGILIKMYEDYFEYVNAGNVDILHVDGETGEVTVPGDADRLFRCCFLGVPDTDCSVVPVRVPFRKGDSVILFSDGLVEGTDTDGLLYGLNRVIESVRRARSSRTMDQLTSAIIRDLFSFTSSRRLDDDLTLIAIRKK